MFSEMLHKEQWRRKLEAAGFQTRDGEEHAFSLSERYGHVLLERARLEEQTRAPVGVARK